VPCDPGVGGWPTFTFFVKVGATRPASQRFLMVRINKWRVSKIKITSAGGMSPHLYKERKGGPATYEFVQTPMGTIAMSGPTLGWGRVPLPGGGEFVVTASVNWYNHPDWQGASRVETTTGGTLQAQTEYTPFGSGYDGVTSNCCDYTFNGGSHPDMFGGLYDTPNRELQPVQGRWIQPDPSGLAAVDPSNPQSWNRYAYVLNNPLSFIDPTGLECVWDDGSFDSNDDPRTGNPKQGRANCASDGGTWYEPTDFANRGLGDWSPNPNSELAGEIQQMQGGDPAATFYAQSTAQIPSDPANNGQQPKPCANVPKSPPGASATFNANLVSQEAQGMWPATELDYFYQVFRTGGTFDFKATGGDQYVDYGNWNFGYVCGANYPALFCQSAAGANRMSRAAMQGTNPFGSGVPFVKSPYGDQAADNQQIRNGIQAQASGCVQ
jgi:RHS repeat-associated protein